MEIINELISIAKANNVSAQSIADRAGLDRKTVSSILSGENSNPRVQTVEAIAEALKAELIIETDLSRAVRTSSGELAYYRKCIADKQELVDHMQEQYQKTETNLRRIIEDKNRWIERLFVVALFFIITSVVLGVFAFNA